jgi:hypothetical protein
MSLSQNEFLCTQNEPFYEYSAGPLLAYGRPKMIYFLSTSPQNDLFFVHDSFELELIEPEKETLLYSSPLTRPINASRPLAGRQFCCRNETVGYSNEYCEYVASAIYIIHVFYMNEI